MVKDFRQDSSHEVENVGRAGRRLVRNKAQNRQSVVVGIYLSAAMMVLIGVGLLTLKQGSVPASDAHGVALLCFALAAVDVLLVQYLKWTWRKRDGR